MFSESTGRSMVKFVIFIVINGYVFVGVFDTMIEIDGFYALLLN